MTMVGFPVFVYSTGNAASGTLKLNGKLVTLAEAGEGTFAAGGVRARVQPVDEGSSREGQRAADFIVMLPGAQHELGFRGFAACETVS